MMARWAVRQVAEALKEQAEYVQWILNLGDDMEEILFATRVFVNAYLALIADASSVEKCENEAELGVEKCEKKG